MDSWYVLTDGVLVWGQLWETVHGSPKHPRHKMLPLRYSIEFRPILLRFLWIDEELRLAKKLKGLCLHPVKVMFHGQGSHAEIKMQPTNLSQEKDSL